MLLVGYIVGLVLIGFCCSVFFNIEKTRKRKNLDDLGVLLTVFSALWPVAIPVGIIMYTVLVIVQTLGKLSAAVSRLIINKQKISLSKE